MRGLPRNQVLVGNAAERLKELPAGSVDCIVTSPPYYALRDYQADGQIGLETSVDGWVHDLLAVMHEAGRVLKPTGTVWLNLGDSYARHPNQGALPKSLLLGPERLATQLLEHGWLIRNKIAWVKPDPMPASVTDRFTAAWEPLYLLTRSRHYYFDLDAIRVPHRSGQRARRDSPVPEERPAWAGPLAGNQSGLKRLHNSGLPGHPLGKNPGDWWAITTARGGQGHHASFPEALVERPITAGCPERVCSGCGQPWRREAVDRSLGHLAVLGKLRPACACRAEWQPGIVLDPFMGSGTTAVVAERLGRDWVGIELNPAFAALTERRVSTARAGPLSKAA